jgi:NifU-like protein involved in Fe-S cluster formation
MDYEKIGKLVEGKTIEEKLKILNIAESTTDDQTDKLILQCGIIVFSLLSDISNLKQRVSELEKRCPKGLTTVE